MVVQYIMSLDILFLFFFVGTIDNGPLYVDFFTHKSTCFTHTGRTTQMIHIGNLNSKKK